MRYPEILKSGDTIGITAPSCGVGEEDVLRYENAIKNMEKIGYKVVETESVRRENVREATAKQRALELMKLWENPEVKSIICVSGGDFTCEVLDELDFDKLKGIEPKWIQGYSDITSLGYIFTTNLDIATIYGPTFKTYGMKKLHDSLIYSIELMKKEDIIMESYDKCESIDKWDSDDEDPYKEYNLTSDVRWENLNNEKEIKFSGRAIGGCFDVILNLIGTKYDKTKEFIKKYKKDGIVWFFDIFEKSTPQIFTSLWQMKNAGYFENCKGIIFGRPLFVREEYEMTFEDSIREAIKGLNIPVIINADIGHLAPQISIVNGGIIEVNFQNGKGTLRNIFK